MVWVIIAIIAFIGFLIGRWIGLFIGLSIGIAYLFNFAAYGALESCRYHPRMRGVLKYHYICALFSVLGCIAKADDLVSQDQIDYANLVMDRMNLNPKMRDLAIEQFNLGKQNTFLLSRALNKLKVYCGNDDSLLELFVLAQLEMAKLNGFHEKTSRMLIWICDVLGFGVVKVDVYTSYFKHSQEQQHQHQYQRRDRNSHQQYNKKQPAAYSPYQVLSLSEGAAFAEVKQAYRRMIKECHPDRAIARGASAEEIKQATMRTQQVYAAYKEIQKRQTV